MRKKTKATREFENVQTAELLEGLEGVDVYLAAAIYNQMEANFAKNPLSFEEAIHALEWDDEYARILREIVADFPEEGDQYVLHQVKETFCPENEYVLFAAIKCLRQEMGHYPLPWVD